MYPLEPDSCYHLTDTAIYGPWVFSVSSDSILARADRFVRNSIQLADSLDASIDWKRYQSFLLFHAGADFQGDIQQDTNYDIPSFNLGLGDSMEVVVGGPDSVKINLVMVVPETVSQDGFTAALNGVMAHEFGHQLGFFDLYNVFSGSPVVGMFSLMDSGESMYGTVADPYDSTQAVAVRGILPASVDPWHRILFPFFNITVHEPTDGDVVPPCRGSCCRTTCCTFRSIWPSTTCARRGPRATRRIVSGSSGRIRRRGLCSAPSRPRATPRMH